jgi:hypothetical protein
VKEEGGHTTQVYVQDERLGREEIVWITSRGVICRMWGSPYL